MRRALSFVLTFIFIAASVVMAQVPQAFHHQMVVRNTNDVLVRSHSVGLRFTIQSHNSGSPVILYQETQTSTTDQNGLVQVEVGRGTRNTSYGEFSAIQWGNYTDIELKTEVDPTGGTSYTLYVIQPLQAVPYAFFANEQQTLQNAVNLGNRAGDNQLKSVKDPTEAQDVVTKRYLDSVIAELVRRNNSLTRDTAACVTPASLPFVWRGSDRNSAGIYRYTIAAAGAGGLDSVIILTLTVSNGTHLVATETACDNYDWHGNNYTVTGNYTYEYTDANGCPSADTLHLTILPAVTLTATNLTQTLCQGTAITDIVVTNTNSSISVTGLPTGVSYNNVSGKIEGTPSVAGIFNFTITATSDNAPTCANQTENGTITVKPTSVGDTSANECDHFVWYGNNYTSTSSQTHVFTAANGCDSTVTLNLTINASTTGDTNATKCDNFTWYGNNYASSGDQTHHFTNAKGCDSTVTLHLTINQSTTGDTNATKCDNFTWYGTPYASSSTPTHTFTNVSGCDSVVTLHLTVNPSTSVDTNATACGSFAWRGITYNATPLTAPTATTTKANGCDSVVTLNLTINQSPTLTVGSQTNVLCYDGSTGSVTLSATGGTVDGEHPYQYKNGSGDWQASATFGTLAADDYTFTVKDKNNCQGTISTTITQPSELGLVVNHAASPMNSLFILLGYDGGEVELDCHGNLATLTFDANGGVGGYRFSKDNWTSSQSGADSNIFTNLTPGDYIFKVKDANNCEGYFPVTIIEPSALVLTATPTHALCNGGTGSVTLSSTGGTETVKYSDTEDGTYSASNTTYGSLSAGSHTFYAKDVWGCKTSATTTITQPDALALTGDVSTAIACHGGTATVTLSVTGGSGDYRFSKDNWTTTQSTGDSNVFTSLSAGDYTFKVKDRNDCEATFNLTVTEPDELTLSGSQTNVLCYGGSTGSVTLSATGGTVDGEHPYQYKNGSGDWQASATFGTLAADDYTFTVKDQNNCQATLDVTITQPASALSATKATTGPLCGYDSPMGTIVITASGGTSPYQYRVDGDEGDYDDENTLSASVSPATHTYYVKDNNGCVVSAGFSIAAAPRFSVTFASDEITICQGETTTLDATVVHDRWIKNYTLTASPSGASAGMPGSTSGSENSNGTHHLTFDVSPTTTTVYTLSVQDNAGSPYCSIVRNVTVTVKPTSAYTENLTACDSLWWHDTKYTTAQTDGSVTYTSTGGAANGCDSITTLNLTEVYTTAHTAYTASGLGSYTWATDGDKGHGDGIEYNASGDYVGPEYNDANGCHAHDTLHLTITPINIAGVLNGKFSVAADKKVLFSQGNLQYINAPNDGYAAQSFRFALHQYDFVGGTSTTEPTGTFGNVYLNNGTQCGNQNVSNSYTGWIDLFGWGTSKWNSGASNYMPYSTETTGSTYNPGGSTANNLTGDYANADWGVYNPIVNGGNTAGQFRVLTSDEWSYLLNSRTNASSKRSQGRIYLGGDNYVKGVILLPDEWTLPTGCTFVTDFATNGYTTNTYTLEQWALMQANGAVFLPQAGKRNGTEYIVTIGYEARYWSSTQYNNINANAFYFRDGYISESTTASRGMGNSVRLVFDDVDCVTSSGAVSETACDSYLWAANGVTYNASGTYTARIINRHGCDSTVTLTLTIKPTTSVDTNAVACSTFTWRGNTYTETPLSAPTNTTTKANGCDSVVTLHLTVNPNPTLSVGSQTNVLCYGNSTGSVTLSASGSSGYTYKKDDGDYQASATFGTLAAGDYSFTVKDANNCQASTNATITQPASALSVNATENTTITVGDNIDLTATPAGGTGPYTYAWAANTADDVANIADDDAATTNVAPTATTTYTITVTDANGCEATTTTTLTTESGIIHSYKTVTACDSYTWTENAIEQGTYTTSQGSNGNEESLPKYVYSRGGGLSDSVVHLVLTIKNSAVRDSVGSECESYTWRGNTYTSSGIYEKVFPTAAANGCDSTVRLTLTIGHSNTGDTIAAGCNTFTWYGNTYTESTNTPTHNSTNVSGCDSTTTLHLTIYHSGNTAYYDTSIGPYIWATSGSKGRGTGDTYNTTGKYIGPEDAISGCTGVDTLYLLILPIEGAIPGKFSIAADKQVYFANGNLQWLAKSNGEYADNSWRFAPAQYTVLLSNTTIGGNTTSSANRPTQTKWIDLFAYGTSGYAGYGNTNYMPFYCTNDNTGLIGNHSLTSDYSNADWAWYNAIQGGGNGPYIWRTLTKDEIAYLLNTRTNSSSKRSLGQVNSVSGLILLPDDWTLPTGLSFTPTTANSTTNKYTIEQWARMEAHGAIFLPIGGSGNNAGVTPGNGRYWTSTNSTSTLSYSLSFAATTAPSTANTANEFLCYSLRPVYDAPTPSSGCAITYSSINVQSCDRYTWPINGRTYYASTTTIGRTTNAAGCDSLITLNLTIKSSDSKNYYAAALDSYIWPTSGDKGHGTGSTYTTSDQQIIGQRYDGSNSCDAYDTLHLTITPIQGAIAHPFSVAADKQVYFSNGNLQFQGSTSTWRFAEHQYTAIGNAAGNTTAVASRATNTNWIDLFPYGTSGWSGSATYYQPYEVNITDASYCNAHLTGDKSNADWGVYNAISNGGNVSELWRTLTSAEMIYLLKTRSGYADKKATASINGVIGTILLPDDWVLPVGCTFTAGDYSTSSPTNVYTLAQWADMEANGAIFLPLGGHRANTNTTTLTTTLGYGSYWTATSYSSSSAYRLYQANGSAPQCTTTSVYKHYGYSVRLVVNAPTTCATRMTTDMGTETITNCGPYTYHGTTYYADTVTTVRFLNASGCDTLVRLTLTIKSTGDYYKVNPDADSYTWEASGDKGHGTGETYDENDAGIILGPTYTAANGCTSRDTLKLSFTPPGRLSGLFSVSSTKQVYFSQGNLQYTTTGEHAVATGGTQSGTWRFAEHQYDFVGGTSTATPAGTYGNVYVDAVQSGNQNVTSSYPGWIDLFGWGTSGWNSGATGYMPYYTTATASYYYPGGNASNNLTGDYANADWGIFNAISNGGNAPNLWRTLTSAEWKYILSDRTNAAKKRAECTVNGIKGLIIMPDSYDGDLSSRVLGTYGYNSYTYTLSQWEELESNGAVFLPQAGARNTGGTTYSVGASYYARYWSSTQNAANYAYHLYFYDKSIYPQNSGYRYIGAAVRLVMDKE